MSGVFFSPCNLPNHAMCRTTLCSNIELLEGFGNHHYTCVNPECNKKNCFKLKQKLLYELNNLNILCCTCQNIIKKYTIKFNNKKDEINKLYLLFLLLANTSIDSNGKYIIREVLYEIDTQDIDYWFGVFNHVQTDYCENIGSNTTCPFPGCNTYKNSNIIELLKHNEIVNIFEIVEYVDIIQYISNLLLIRHVLTCNSPMGFCEDSDCLEQKLSLYKL